MASHHAVARDWIFSRPSGLRIDVAAFLGYENLGIVVIEIPKQAPSSTRSSCDVLTSLVACGASTFALPIQNEADTSPCDVAQ